MRERVHKKNYVNKNLSQFDKQRQTSEEREKRQKERKKRSFTGKIPLGFLIKPLAYSQRISTTELIAFFEVD